MTFWKWVLAYVVIRHATRPDPPQPEPESVGYFSILSMGLLVTLFAAFPIWVVWSFLPLRIASIVFLTVVWVIVATGVRYRWRETH